MMDQKLRILLIDDEKNILMLLYMSLTDMGHTVVPASSLKDAVEALKKEPFDLILTDFQLKGPTGLDVIREAKDIQPEALIVVITAYPSIKNVVEVTKKGAVDYLAKPFSNLELECVLQKVQTLISSDMTNKNCTN